MSRPRSADDFTAIRARLAELRPHGAISTETDRIVPLEAIPFFDAPLGVKGIIKFNKPGDFSMGKRCGKCVSARFCSCFSDKEPRYWIGLPSGWLIP